MQDVGGRVIGPNGGAPIVSYRQLQKYPQADGTIFHHPLMNDEIAQLFDRVGHSEPNTRPDQDAGITDLPTGLAVERGLVHDDRPGLTIVQPIDLPPILNESANSAFNLFGVISEEFGRADLIFDAKPNGLRR